MTPEEEAAFYRRRSHSLAQPIEPIGAIGLKTIDPIAIGKEVPSTSKRVAVTVDEALEQTADLRTETDPRSGEKMSGWYKNKIDRLGIPRYLGLASEARQNYKTTKQRYFTFLLMKYGG